LLKMHFWCLHKTASWLQSPKDYCRFWLSERDNHVLLQLQLSYATRNAPHMRNSVEQAEPLSMLLMA